MRTLHFIIETLSGIIILIFMLRLLLPLFGADFRNPISQGVVRITSPVVNPLRRVIPSIGRMDTATVLVMLVVQMAATYLIWSLYKMPRPIGLVFVWSIFELFIYAVTVLLFVLIVRVVLSWIAPQTYNPIVAIVHSLTEPLVRPFQRLIPPIGGLDISVLFVFFALGLARYLLEDLRALLLV